MKRFFLFTVLILLVLPLVSQQFGKQLVTYNKCEWKYVETEHFRIFFYAEQTEEILPQLISLTEGAYKNLSSKLEFDPLFPLVKAEILVPFFGMIIPVQFQYFETRKLTAKEKIPIVFYSNRGDFWRTQTGGGYPPIGAGAFAESRHWRVVMPTTYDPKTMSALITHELGHIFQFSCWYKGKMGLLQEMGRKDVLWYFEGFSQHLSGLHLFRPTDIYLTRLLVLKDVIPSIGVWKYFGAYEINYNLAPHFMDFIVDQYGQRMIKEIFHKIGQCGPTDKALGIAFSQLLKKSIGQLDLEFRDWLRNKYKHLFLKHEAHYYGANLLLAVRELKDSSVVLVSGYRSAPSQTDEEKNKKRGKKVKFLYEPAVSPDGKQIAGWTARKDKFTLVLADAKDCTFIKELTPGYSLRKFGVWPKFNPYFGEGRGLSWSRSNPEQLLFIAETLEKSLVLIIIDPKTNRSQKVFLPFDEPTSPEMFSDGQKVIFSGMKNGQCDIFSLDLKTKEFENLTNDLQFDYAPSIFPDQQTIVYVSKGSERTKLFLLDLKSKEKKQVTFGDSNEIRPVCLSQEKIIFLSDFGSDKIYNIYVLDLKSGEIKQFTDLIYGVVSVLPKDENQILFSAPDYRVWQRSHVFNLYQANFANLLAIPMDSSFSVNSSSIVPDNSQLGVSQESVGEVKKYKPWSDLHVQKAGTLGMSWFSRYGFYFYGWGSLWAYDLLAEQQFSLNYFLYGKYYQTINAGYFNLRGKNSWGLTFSREKRQLFPWWSFGGMNKPAFDHVFNDLWTNQNTLSFFKVYPLNLCNRFEFNLSASSTKFDHSDLSEWQLVSPLRAEFLGKYFQSGSFLEASATFVRDTVVYGNQTGRPMTGSASRFNLSWSTGNFRKMASLELRKYFRISSQVALAWRGLFGLQDGRAILPFMVGDFGELRGYETAQFTGNRLFLSNLELRFPLIYDLRGPLFRITNVRGAIFCDVARIDWSDKKFNELNDNDFSSRPWKGAFGIDLDFGSISLPFIGVRGLHFSISKKFTILPFVFQKDWSFKFYFGYSF